MNTSSCFFEYTAAQLLHHTGRSVGGFCMLMSSHCLVVQIPGPVTQTF